MASTLSSTARKHVTPKGFSVEDIAAKVGLSAACVYQHIAKDKPNPVSQEGKRRFYSETYIESLKQSNIRPRARRMKMIAPKAPRVEKAPEKQQESNMSLAARIEALERTNQELIMSLKTLRQEVHGVS